LYGRYRGDSATYEFLMNFRATTKSA